MKNLLRESLRVVLLFAIAVTAVYAVDNYFDNVITHSVKLFNGSLGGNSIQILPPTTVTTSGVQAFFPNFTTGSTVGVIQGSITNNHLAKFTVSGSNIILADGGAAGGAGTVTSVSVTTQNGVSATVTNPTTTPALAFTLGAITPSSVASTGNISASAGSLSVSGTLSFSGSQAFNSFTGNGLKVATGTGTYTSGHGIVVDASGNLIDSGSAGGGGVTNLSGTANQITASASTGAVTLSIPSALVLPGTATVSGGGVYKGTTLFGVGDSIAFGAGGVTPFPTIIGTDATWTVDNTNSISGRGTSEQQGVVDVATVTASTNTVYEIGINDMDSYWVNAGNAANAVLANVYKLAAMYETAIMAIPNGNRYAANNAAITYTGTWTGFPGHAPAQQSSIGTATWTTPGGRAIYVGTDLVVGNLGTFTLSVDGVSTGVTYNCFSSQNVTSLQGSTYVPQLIRIDSVLGIPLTDVPHTVILTITSANDASHLVYLTWVGWSIGQRNVVGPNVYVNGITKKTAGGYVTFGSTDANTATYNQNIRDNVQLLANDGLNITFVDNANILTATMLQADGLHPNQTGQNQMAINNEEEITGAGSTRIKGSPVDTDLNRQFFGSTVNLGRTTQLYWGAASASFPMMKRATTTVAFRLADDSADAGITALRLTFPTNGTVGAGSNILWNTNDGIYSTSAGSIDFSINGSRQIAFQNGLIAIISNTGNVLFGTSFDAGLRRDGAGRIQVNNGSDCVTASNCADLMLRHALASGAAPTIASGFGTGSTIAGRDEAIRVTLGTTPGTGGVVTFGTAYTNAPVCTAVDETTLTVTLTTTPTTTNVTITSVAGVLLLSDKIGIICRSYL